MSTSASSDASHIAVAAQPSANDATTSSGNVWATPYSASAAAKPNAPPAGDDAATAVVGEDREDGPDDRARRGRDEHGARLRVAESEVHRGTTRRRPQARSRRTRRSGGRRGVRRGGSERCSVPPWLSSARSGPWPNSVGRPAGRTLCNSPVVSGASEIVAIGGDLEPVTLIAAYAQGLFPMKVEDVLAWWSPDPRGILPLDGFHRSRSLRRSIPTLRSPRRHGVRGGDARRAATRAGRTDGSTRTSSTPTAACTSWAGRTASRPGSDGDARGRCLRRAHRWVVRGGVDVPSCHRRVEGRAVGDRRTAAASTVRRCSTCSGRRRIWSRSERSTSPVRSIRGSSTQR